MNEDIMRRVGAGEFTFEQALDQGLLGITRSEHLKLTPTQRLRVMGIEDEVVFSGTPAECKAWLRAHASGERSVG